MAFVSFLRNRAFWTLDALKGKAVRSAYDHIQKIDMMESADPFIKTHQENAWKALKAEACTNTVFYKQFENRDFYDFPIITKQDIRGDQDSFLSSKYKKEDLIQMSTSGSTGTPFVCYQNGAKKRRVNAEIIYYSEKVGYKLGDNLSYIRTIVKQNKKSALKQFLQNQTLLNCGQLSDAGIEALISALQAQSKKGSLTLLAYGSTYTAIKNYVQKKDIASIPGMKICGAISGSDMLFDETRAVVSKAFGDIPVVSRYSNEENGVLGQDEGLNNVFAINEANYIVEIIDDNGNPVPDGALGRIVVTDLYNYAMPIIRYDTGDVGAIEVFDINGRKKRCICDFSGRKVDVIFDCDGNACSPHAVTNRMWDFPEIVQFQLIQEDKKAFTLKLNVKDDFNREGEIVSALSSLLGGDAVIEIVRVNEIPVLASGKRRYIINNYKK